MSPSGLQLGTWLVLPDKWAGAAESQESPSCSGEFEEKALGVYEVLESEGSNHENADLGSTYYKSQN